MPNLTPVQIVWVAAAIMFFAALSLVCIHRRIKRHVTSVTLSKIDRMTGTEFEKYLEDLYTAKGFKVTHCGKSGDFGCDLLVARGRKVTAIQAKRWNSHVTVGAVQQVFAARAFYDATDCMVVTNNWYTPAAHRLADKIGVRLIDRSGLTKYINDLKEGNKDVKRL